MKSKNKKTKGILLNLDANQLKEVDKICNGLMTDRTNYIRRLIFEDIESRNEAQENIDNLKEIFNID